MSVTLFRNSVCVGEHVKMISLGWALIQHGWVLRERGHLCTDMHTWRVPYEYRSGDLADSTIQQGMPRNASQLAEASREAWNTSYPHSPERYQPCQNHYCYVSSLQNCDNKFQLNHLICSMLCVAILEN